jgi:hypothetical protein
LIETALIWAVLKVETISRVAPLSRYVGIHAPMPGVSSVAPIPMITMTMINSNNVTPLLFILQNLISGPYGLF